MRTTLDIDDDVLQAAKELARMEKKTAGKVLSEVFRSGIRSRNYGSEVTGGPDGMVMKNGFYLLPHREGGPLITNVLIDQLMEEADLEDAGIKPK